MKNNTFGIFKFIIETPEDLQLVKPYDPHNYWCGRHGKLNQETIISIYVTPDSLRICGHNIDAPLLTREELKKLIGLYK